MVSAYKVVAQRSQKPSKPESRIMGDAAAMAQRTEVPLMGPEVGLLIECNQKLKELGIDKTIKLPQICVIGDQSAGKSSLIEAISTISVPRAAGYCTQCPLAINLSAGRTPDAPFTCKVTIVASYAFSHERRGRQPTKAMPMGPWIPQHEVEMISFATTNDKQKTWELIEMAQAAVLHPSTLNNTTRPSKSLLTEPNEVKFSPNVIRLDITEGSWPSLSFIDLPGVITNTDRGEDQYLIRLVENLVLEYASNESSIILLTLPMTNDTANSKSLSLIQKIAAEDRTMVVLTKPDRADAESRAQFLGGFTKQDENRAFEHGYHIVMLAQPREGQEGVTKQELAFFSQQPWCDIDAKFRGRLGVQALSGFLRHLLFKKTLDTLPQNLKIIDDTLDQIMQDLQQYPDPPIAARLPVQLSRLVDSFSRVIESIFGGNGSMHASFLKDAKHLAEDFRKSILNMTPTLFIGAKVERKKLNKLEKQRGTAADAPLEIPSDDEAGHSDTAACPKKINNLTHRFELEEIKSVLDKYANHGLPAQAHPQAIEYMTMSCLENWDQPLVTFLHRLKKLMFSSVLAEVDRVFHDYNHLPLKEVVTGWTKEFLTRATEDEQGMIEELCAIEQTCVHTLDVETFGLKVGQHKEIRQQKRSAFRLKLAQLAADLEPSSGKNKRVVIAIADLGPDPYQNEVDKSAEVKAYYEIAASRFTDAVYQRIRAKLFRRCGQVLPAQLRAFLEPEDGSMHEQLIEWMTEDTERAKMRRQLKREKERLIEGKKFIEKVLCTEPAASAVNTEVVCGLGRRQRSKSQDAEMENDPDTPTRKRNRQSTVEADNADVAVE